jgi:cystathionine beta-lyase
MFDAAFFDAPLDRSGTNSLKWDIMGPGGPGGIPLWVADMDFRCPPAISEALVARAAHPNYGYTTVDQELLQAFCQFWARRHRVKTLPEEIMLLPSVVSGLRLCVEEFTSPGDGVIILTPVYGPFYRAVKDAERNLLEVPLLRDASGRYSMDLNAVEQHLKAGARLMLLCSPHNPVSRLWSREELEALTGLLARYDCALAADEIHADFVYAPGDFTSMRLLENDAFPLVQLTAASKTFNVAGLQTALAVCRSKEVCEHMQANASRRGIEAGNVFGQVASKAAFLHGDTWLDGLMVYLDKSRDLLRDLLQQLLPEAVLTPIEATYLAWVDLQAYGHSTAEIIERCRKEQVMTTEGTVFNATSGEGHMRINFGCPRTQLQEGIERFARAIKQ